VGQLRVGRKEGVKKGLGASAVFIEKREYAGERGLVQGDFKNRKDNLKKKKGPGPD